MGRWVFTGVRAAALAVVVWRLVRGGRPLPPITVADRVDDAGEPTTGPGAARWADLGAGAMTGAVGDESVARAAGGGASGFGRAGFGGDESGDRAGGAARGGAPSSAGADRAGADGSDGDGRPGVGRGSLPDAPDVSGRIGVESGGGAAGAGAESSRVREAVDGVDGPGRSQAQSATGRSTGACAFRAAPGRVGRGAEVTVVVPARDEANRIGPLLDSIVGAPGVVEVVVVDDRSSDRTAAVAASAGARVVDGAPRPAGWAGKTWALQQGVTAVSTEWVVTLDADARPDPALPVALVERMRADRLDLLTVAGRFDCPTAPSRWLHAAMLTTLVYRYGPPSGSRPASPGRLLANGQCMAARRADLVAPDGLGAVAGSVVEDVALARSFAAAGRRVAFLDAGHLLTVRMFESAAETWHGWGRSLGLPGVDRRWRRTFDVIVLAATMPFPLIRIATGRADPIDAAAVAIRIGTLFGTRNAYRPAGFGYWVSPLADVAAVAALALGVGRRRQTWRGRTFTV